MSHVATAHSGRYTLTIYDTTDSAPDLGTVRMAGIQPAIGEMQRTSSAGPLPCEFQVIAEDPTGELADLFQGSFTEKDYVVELTGPPGPNGTEFYLELWPKEHTNSEPLSSKVHPGRTALTFYDGLARNRREAGSYERLSIGLAPSIRTLLQEVFFRANDRLFVWCRVPVGHTTSNWGGDHGPESLGEIHFPTRSEEGWSSWWDALVELCDRYELVCFQDPYDHDDTNGRPRWKIIPLAEVGAAVQGYTTGSTGFLGPEQADTLAADEVRITENGGALAVEDGSEFESAIVFQVEEGILDDSDKDPYDATVVNGQQAVRDPDFNFENSNNNRPFYGESERVSIITSPRAIQLDPDEGSSTDAFWRSEPFYVGERLVIGQLSYRFELSGGSTVAGARVTVRELNEDGTVASTTDQTGTGTLTLNFSTSDTMVQVEVFVPHDAGANPVYDYEHIYLRLWRNTNGRSLGSDSDVESLRHTADNTGLLEQNQQGYADMLIASVPIVGAGDIAPTSVYQDIITNTETYTAGQLRKTIRFGIRPPGTQTLRTTVADEVLGPNTRILVEDDNGNIQRRLVPSGGRKLTLKDEYTEITDLDVPDLTP